MRADGVQRHRGSHLSGAKTVLGCHGKAEKAGTLDAEYVTGATEKFAVRITKTEKKGTCLTNRDATAIGGTFDAQIDGLVCALDPVRQLVPCH